MISISGYKTWDDNNDADRMRPDSITIRLKADGIEKDSKTVTASDGWAWSFGDLPQYASGREIVYTITEDTVAEYTAEVHGFNVTNRYTPGKTQVTVTKVWDDDDDRDGIRPSSVRIKLLANGEATEQTVTLSASNNWTDTFTDLPVKQDGVQINYTVEEVTGEVITGTDGAGTYEIAVTGDAESGFTVTNKHTSQKAQIEIVKVWDDLDNADKLRPASVTIHLFADGAEVDSKQLTAADDWTWTPEQPMYREGGQEVVYTITEDPVLGYKTEIDGFTVTNKIVARFYANRSACRLPPDTRSRLPKTRRRTNPRIRHMPIGRRRRHRSAF